MQLYNAEYLIAVSIINWLKDHTDGGFHRAQDFATKAGFDLAHVSKVVRTLSRQRLIKTKRGPTGGMKLTGRPTLFAVYKATMGSPMTAIPTVCLRYVPAHLLSKPVQAFVDTLKYMRA